MATCEHCKRRPATVCASDLPEQEGGLLFGDPVCGWLLCDRCLERSERDGPWSAVDYLDAPVILRLVTGSREPRGAEFEVRQRRAAS